ncbi:uncharacterized protein MYCFIDRAFT_169345 [Pseudocercospora fijiensis CIRAD86]|uniref:Uncharacterized protein n=1 Tax=Pseudocercospora fijiensis (strain CIRAD86) TaxID=383855 RepID=N1Q9G2_PSEFD|nr:uncharacterized protein MYCFIDRAFT_169345 [Pseudocercospora fijiensis CIRAD86]EME87528.1 hypothetical protein MYCFIDRAFT_169345 [Pseudocercospora fijiensis CIRAD86]
MLSVVSIAILRAGFEACATGASQPGFARHREKFEKQVALSCKTADTSPLYAQPLPAAPANAGLLRRRTARVDFVAAKRSENGECWRSSQNIAACGRIELRRVAYGLVLADIGLLKVMEGLAEGRYSELAIVQKTSEE